MAAQLKLIQEGKDSMDRQKALEAALAQIDRAFGKGSEFTSWGKVLPVPLSYFQKFSRWNELSVMRHSREFGELQKLERDSLEPERIRAFLARAAARGRQRRPTHRRSAAVR